MNDDHAKDMMDSLQYALQMGILPDPKSAAKLKAEIEKRNIAMQNAAALQQPAGVGGIDPAFSKLTPPAGVNVQAIGRGLRGAIPSLHEQLRVRLRLRDLDELGVKLQIIEDMGTVFVFVVKDGKPATVEDTTEMFPSDQLVTQLRMLAK